MEQEKTEDHDRQCKVLDNLIDREKIEESYFIPYKTVSLFGFIVWGITLLLPIIVIIIIQLSDNVSQNTKYAVDIIMGIWVAVTLSLLLLMVWKKVPNYNK